MYLCVLYTSARCVYCSFLRVVFGSFPYFPCSDFRALCMSVLIDYVGLID